MPEESRVRRIRSSVPVASPARPWLWALAGIYVLARLAGFVGVDVRVFPDTASYLDVARRWPLSPEFLAAERSWALPLLYKLPSDGARAWGQLLVSITCWLGLALATASYMRSKRTTIAGFAAVLVFSCSVWVTQWDAVLLSESVSLSLTAGVLALWLLVARRPTWPVVVAVLAGWTLWVFARDTNAYVGLVALPALAVWAVASPAPRAKALVLAGGVALLFTLSGLSASPDRSPRHRWVTPMFNVLGARILVDEGRTQWFSARGLPVTPLLESQAGAIAGLSGPHGETPPPLWASPELDAARSWVLADMRGTYARYLLTHPGYALAPLVSHREELLSVEPRTTLPENYPLSHYRPAEARAVLPGLLDGLVFPRPAWGVLASALVVAGVAGVAVRRTRPGRHWLVPVATLAVTPAHLLLVWHGDAAEVTRHAIVATVSVRLALVLLAVLAVDELLAPRSSRDQLVTPAEDTAPAVR